MLRLGAQRLLEVPSPRVEARLGRRIEAQEGQFLGRQLLRAERRRRQGGQALEDFVYARRASAFGQRSTFCHRPPPSGHTASWKRCSSPSSPRPAKTART
jgi:hypothetical protein